MPDDREQPAAGRALELLRPPVLFVWSGVVDGALLCGHLRRRTHFYYSEDFYSSSIKYYGHLTAL
jgi:hypothetical protein